MSTQHQEIFERLAAPFRENELKQHPYHKFWYATARTVANRLDEVLGPENWEPEPLPWNDVAVKYRLTITLPDGSKSTKYAVGSKTILFTGGKSEGKVDKGEADKGGDSDAFKRAAAMFGVGRYLYNEGVPEYGTAQQAAPQPQKPQDTRTKTERLIDWANKEGHYERVQALSQSLYCVDAQILSEGQATNVYKIIKDAKPVANLPQPAPRAPEHEANPAEQAHAPGKNGNGNAKTFGWPTSGAALLAWMKNVGNSFKTDVKGSVQEAFCGQAVPQDKRWDTYFLRWNPEQVQQAALYVAGLVRNFPGYTGEFDARLPRGLEQIRDDLWEVAGRLVEAVGEQPTTEMIEMEIQRTSQALAAQFSGEVVEDIQKCESEPMLTAILETMKTDLKDVAATY